MTTDTMTLDEVAMLRFLQMCIPSLEPSTYQSVLDACDAMATARNGLDQHSRLRCLRQILGDDYVEPTPCESSSS